ncbi:MAG: class I SAM-dependent methyltransferase [Candidatus Eremiobacteraeota bacterium]|nr:class I SAM-dependent methyltransferase [Candidatus Eremiobacteraeota bacterium]
MNEPAGAPNAARFDGLAATYERFRPSYPADAIAAILADLPIGPTVVDVGAGTGISTRALVAAGAHAIAIEPNDEMRAIARECGVDARPGTATATGLSDRCAEAVACFQAFHWFATPEALAEFGRILRPSGRVALVWNERDTTDPFTADYAAIERRRCGSDGRAAIDCPDILIETLLVENGFAGLRRATFANEQRMDADAVIGRMRSSSYAPREAAVLDLLVAELRAAHELHAASDGFVTFRYRTEVTLAELGPP